jgi:hypothetical protein
MRFFVYRYGFQGHAFSDKNRCNRQFSSIHINAGVKCPADSAGRHQPEMAPASTHKPLPDRQQERRPEPQRGGIARICNLPDQQPDLIWLGGERSLAHHLYGLWAFFRYWYGFLGELQQFLNNTVERTLKPIAIGR